MEVVENKNYESTMGVVAYMTLIGWIIALVQNGEKKGEEKAFVAFHLRQMLGLFIFSFGFGFVYIILSIILIWIPFLGAILLFLLPLGLFGGLLALWIMGVIAASNKEMKPLPIIGGLIHKMLGTAFN